jgi:hypothetical protein
VLQRRPEPTYERSEGRAGARDRDLLADDGTDGELEAV